MTRMPVPRSRQHGLSYVIGAIAVFALCGLLASVFPAYAALRHGDMAAANVFASWASAFGALFGGCAIYLGFLETAAQQQLDRNERRLRESTDLLRRLRTDPMLEFFIQTIGYGLIGPRRLVLPEQLAVLYGAPTFEYDPAELAASLGQEPGFPPLKSVLYGDAYSVGLDYLTEVALLVEHDVIAYRDLGALAYFLEQMRNPAFARGKFLWFLEKYRYDAVLRLLERDPSIIVR